MAARVCDFCRKGEADTFFQWSGLVGSHEKAMCRECSGRMGLEGAPFDVAKAAAEVFSGLCREEAPRCAVGEPAPDKCPHCGTDLQTILDKSLIGCEKCYVVFRSLIKSSLVGTRKGEDPENSIVDRFVQELSEAIAAEDYERAAQLRDQIKKELANAKP